MKHHIENPFWDHPDVPCDIHGWVQSMCLQYMAPRTLCCAVYTCGPEYSAMAFDAPKALVDSCGLNMTEDIVGRRNTIIGPSPGGDICTDYGDLTPPSLVGRSLEVL